MITPSRSLLNLEITLFQALHLVLLVFVAIALVWLSLLASFVASSGIAVVALLGLKRRDDWIRIVDAEFTV